MARHANIDASSTAGSVVSQKKDTGRNRLLKALMVLFILIALVCLLGIGLIVWQYIDGTRQYDEIADNAVLFAVESDADQVDESLALADYTVDWDYLKSVNEDTVAWVYMPGTNINYPVVQGDSDSQYLTMDFDGSTSGFVHKGAIFLSSGNASDFSDEVSFLYGHNMNDDTMFAQLLDFVDQDTLDEHHTLYILTPTMNYQATVFAVDKVANTDVDLLTYNFDTIDEFQSFLQERSDEALATEDVGFDAVTKAFGLITCGDDYASTRIIAFAGVTDSATPSTGDDAVFTVEESGRDPGVVKDA